MLISNISPSLEDSRAVPSVASFSFEPPCFGVFVNRVQLSPLIYLASSLVLKIALRWLGRKAGWRAASTVGQVEKKGGEVSLCL